MYVYANPVTLSFHDTTTNPQASAKHSGENFVIEQIRLIKSISY